MPFASNNFKVVFRILKKSIFDEHIIHIILKYYWDILDNKQRVLCNWIDKSKLTNLIYINKYSIDYIYANNMSCIDWNILSSNSNAISLLKHHINKINWSRLSKNPGAIELLKTHKDLIIWNELSFNINAIDLIEERVNYEHSLCVNEYIKLYNKLNWMVLSKYKNPKIVSLIEKRIIYENKFSAKDYEYLNYNEQLNWEEISSNSFAIKIIKKYFNRVYMNKLCRNPNIFEIILVEFEFNINWFELSSNPNAIKVLQNNISKINWNKLCSNPNAIELIKNRIVFERNNPHTYDRGNCIDWNELSSNPNAIEILEQNKDKINWYKLCMNNNIKETIELIKNRVIYESKLHNGISKINWVILSSNPKIFEEEPIPKI